MPTIITREEVQRLVREEGAQLVDVLPRTEYDEEHIAGAISLPLKEFDAEGVGTLDRTRPVITYCHDYI